MNKAMRFALLSALTITLLSACSGPSSEVTELKKEMDSIRTVKERADTSHTYINEVTFGDTGAWGGNLRLPLAGTEHNADGSVTLLVSGELKDREIELKIKLPAVKKEAKKGFHNDAITLMSTGEKSDHFLESLAEMYQVPLKSKRFTKELRVTYVDLNEMAVLLGGKNEPSDEVQLKLFYEDPKDENAGFELYLNYNLEKGWVEFAEKDSEYRGNIIKAMGNN
jgi:hypothetical protein